MEDINTCNSSLTTCTAQRGKQLPQACVQVIIVSENTPFFTYSKTHLKTPSSFMHITHSCPQSSNTKQLMYTRYLQILHTLLHQSASYCVAFNLLSLSFTLSFIALAMKSLSLAKAMASSLFLDRYPLSTAVWGLSLASGWCNLYLNSFLVMTGTHRPSGRGTRSLPVRRSTNSGCFFRTFTTSVNDCSLAPSKSDITRFGYVSPVREIKYNQTSELLKFYDNFIKL